MGLKEGNPRQRLVTMEWEENLRPREAALTHVTQQMTITRQRNDAAREADLLSLSSFSTIRNSPCIRGNVNLSPESGAKLKQDSGYHDSDGLDNQKWFFQAYQYNIDLCSGMSHARLKEDSEYYIMVTNRICSVFL